MINFHILKPFLIADRILLQLFAIYISSIKESFWKELVKLRKEIVYEYSTFLPSISHFKFVSEHKTFLTLMHVFVIIIQLSFHIFSSLRNIKLVSFHVFMIVIHFQSSQFCNLFGEALITNPCFFYRDFS